VIAAYFVVMANLKEEPEESAPTVVQKPKTEFINACKVIVKTDAEAAFGVKFKDGNPENTTGAIVKSCKYEEATDGSVPALIKATNLRVQVDTYETIDSAKLGIDTTRKLDTIDGKVFFVATDAPDVGDQAFFFQGQAPLTIKTEEYLYVRKGSRVYHFVAVRIDGIDHAKAKIALAELAKKSVK
jgi:hypothetical protein